MLAFGLSLFCSFLVLLDPTIYLDYYLKNNTKGADKVSEERSVWLQWKAEIVNVDIQNVNHVKTV